MKVFASVGSVLPFDRLVRAVDDWALVHPEHEVFLQIGDGEYAPQYAPWKRTMPHPEYHQLLSGCDLFVAHVGMGSILQALELRRQTLLMPRLAAMREHTTDHQLHTAARFRDTAGILIVETPEALQDAMSRLIENPLESADGLSPFAPEAFTSRIAEFLKTGR